MIDKFIKRDLVEFENIVCVETSDTAKPTNVCDIRSELFLG